MQKVKLVQFSLQHINALKKIQKHVPITRKEIEVYKKCFDFIDFNNNHRKLRLNEVVQDPSRKDRVVIWCENYNMDEDIAYKDICNYYRDVMSAEIQKGKEVLEKKEAQFSLPDEELFKIRKGG